MRGVIAGRQHQPVEELSYGERVASLELGRGTNDASRVVADCYEFSFKYFESFHQS